MVPVNLVPVIVHHKPSLCNLLALCGLTWETSYCASHISIEFDQV